MADRSNINFSAHLDLVMLDHGNPLCESNLIFLGFTLEERAVITSLSLLFPGIYSAVSDTHSCGQIFITINGEPLKSYVLANQFHNAGLLVASSSYEDAFYLATADYKPNVTDYDRPFEFVQSALIHPDYHPSKGNYTEIRKSILVHR